MSSAPVGKWVVVRSDRLVLSIDKADHLYIVGRSRQLPSSQTLSHKYASRDQLALVWHPPHLHVAQLGKNPSFLGAACDTVPRLPSPEEPASAEGETSALSAAAVTAKALLHFTPSAAVTEAAAHKTPSGEGMVVEVPLSDPLTVTQAPDRQVVTAATVFFPEELGLPSLTVRFESAEVARADATAAATTRSAAEMLAVPSLRKVEASDSDDEDELEDDERGPRKPPASAKESANAVGDGGSAARPEWRGLLDVALHEQQRQDAAARASEGSRNAPAVTAAPAPAAAPAPPPPAVPSAVVPFGSSAEKAVETATAQPTASAPKPQPQEHHQHHMGFWEWMCHADGDASDPKSWRKYNKAVAELLEKAYRNPKTVTVKIPDSAMFDKPGAKGCTYGVCFAEKAVDGAMIQYVLDKPGRFRVVRRTGGTPVDRSKSKKGHVIPSSSSSESEESFSDDSDDDDDDDDDDEDESDSEESVSSSSSSDAPKKKKRRH